MTSVPYLLIVVQRRETVRMTYRVALNILVQGLPSLAALVLKEHCYGGAAPNMCNGCN